MPELDFKIEDVNIEPFAAVPTLTFDLRIGSPDRAIRNIALASQIRIEPARRGYGPAEQERLSELFGETRRWGQTLRGFLWDHVNLPVAPFETECVVKLPLACSYDFNIAATKYFHGLDEGVAPLSFLFSGAVFYDDADGYLQIGQIAWTKDASFNLPIAIWRKLMAQYYPDTTWLQVPNALFERLSHYKRANGFTDWEKALSSLIGAATLEPLS
jgi:hypothetical protein